MISSAIELLPEKSRECLAVDFLTPERVEQVIAYSELLVSWNKSMDLIAPAELEHVAERHLCDSVIASLLMTGLVDGETRNAVDVGSGAGLPGIVAAICRPDWSFLLCEPREKRTIFLKEVRRQLELENIEISRGRYESLEISSPQSLVFSRALGRPELVLGSAKGHLEKGGLVVELVSANWQKDEALLARHPEYRFLGVYQYVLPESKVARGLAVWRLC